MALLLPDAAGWGALLIGITLGAMLFFSACVAPLVFMRLQPEIAGRFIYPKAPVDKTAESGDSCDQVITCARGCAGVSAC